MRTATVLTATLLLGACRSAYYDALETVGYHKRDLLVSRVESARDAQDTAKRQFESALEEFSAVIGFDGGDLERRYEDLEREHARSESAADAVTERINSVENVAEALFAEWQQELDEYNSDALRRNSQRQLEETRARYARLIRAMRGADAKTEPVLTAFRDTVLALKHNLNAQAIASLQSELNAVETDVEALIREMEASIREADAFLDAMQAERGSRTGAAGVPGTKRAASNL
ncbi:MAG TPA: DUF2959 domain-containing protein [Gammaproteobacteria bacterium]|nr:DUF2959 domain-containing protein [Gammaproteobacteria bacterium]